MRGRGRFVAGAWAVALLALLVGATMPTPTRAQTDCAGTLCFGSLGSTNAWTATNTFSGKLVRSVQTVTVADNTVGASPAAFNLTPTGSYIEITCNDADGCNATLIETNAVEGHEVQTVNVGTNTVNFADTANVSELAGVFAAGQYDTLTLVYLGDRWAELARANN